MKIREYSDIHLDSYPDNDKWYPPELPDDKETILILAGDIWEGTKFIRHGDNSWISKVAPRFKEVLLVLGNHDYWPHGRGSIRGLAKKCNTLLAEADICNAQVLDCSTKEVDDIIFVGATLWTDMNNMNPLTMHNMPNLMNYDGKIAYEVGVNGHWSRFTSEKWVTTHIHHKAYIDLVASDNPDKKIVVISHHVPLLTISDPKYEGDWSNGYFHSDLSGLILDRPNIKYWFYGHTHYQNKTQLEHCTLINNCVGYRSEAKFNEETKRIKHEVLEI